MAKRRIHTESNGDKSVKVFYNPEFSEYIARLYLNGVLNAAADYFTPDKQDAIETAAAMVRPRDIAPVSRAFNIAVLHITSRVLPCGYDVSEIAPQDFDSLVSHYDKTGRVLVWSGASDRTIFADCEVNYAFRAWHDSKHITGNFPFSWEGESAAMQAQMDDIRALYDGKIAEYFCDLLTAEIQGQKQYQDARGGFPLDQIGFAQSYLVNPAHAISGNFGISREAQ